MNKTSKDTLEEKKKRKKKGTLNVEKCTMAV